jgi:hypothetical protein
LVNYWITSKIFNGDMIKILIQYTGAALFLLAGAWLVRDGLKKIDEKSAMRFAHYRPVKNYGKGFSIALGILCLVCGVLLILAG